MAEEERVDGERSDEPLHAQSHRDARRGAFRSFDPADLGLTDAAAPMLKEVARQLPPPPPGHRRRNPETAEWLASRSPKHLADWTPEMLAMAKASVDRLNELAARRDTADGAPPAGS
jgi:hypothetical protein